MIQQHSCIPHGAIKSYLFFVIRFLEAGVFSHQFNYFTAKLLSSSATPWEPHNIHSVNELLSGHVMSLQPFTFSNYLIVLKIAYINLEISQTLKGVSSKHDASCTAFHSYSTFRKVSQNDSHRIPKGTLPFPPSAVLYIQLDMVLIETSIETFLLKANFVWHYHITVLNCSFICVKKSLYTYKKASRKKIIN